MTVAMGAWAQGAKHLITATHDEQTRSLEQPLPYATTVGVLYEAVTGKSFSDLISTMSLAEFPLSGISSNNTDVVSIGDLNGASTPVTVNADGEATIILNFSGYSRGIFVTVTPPLYVTMKDGVKDAGKWTAKVGEGQAQALPIGGLKGDGSETVTLQYNGRLKVKSVTATSDAGAPAAPAGITAARAAYQGTNAPSQNWTKGDKLYVYGPGLELMGTLVADADGAEVLMAGTLDFTKTGTTAPMKLTLSTLPLPLDYRTQDGTQAKMTAYATATATATAIDAEAGTVTLDATPTLAPQQALVKLSLQDANGQPLSPSTLSLDAVDPNGGYSTVTKLRLDLPIDQAPTWAYGDYTYNNGAITLTNNCGVGWNTLSFSDVIVQCTGVIAVFEEGATGAGAITLQYLKNGETEPSYAANSFTQGQTWAWVGVPSDAKEIWGVFFSSGSDTTIKPTRISPNAIGDLTLSPNGSDVYVALKDVGTSNLTLRAKVGEKYYIYSGSVTFNEGNYYEQTVQMTED